MQSDAGLSPHTIDMNQWKVQMFAYLRERHGDEVLVAAEPNVNSVLGALAQIGVATAGCRLAIDDEFAQLADAVPEGSSLALIPPVSGG
jgi:molybdopterin converting factor small subunit